MNEMIKRLEAELEEKRKMLNEKKKIAELEKKLKDADNELFEKTPTGKLFKKGKSILEKIMKN